MIILIQPFVNSLRAYRIRRTRAPRVHYYGMLTFASPCNITFAELPQAPAVHRRVGTVAGYFNFDPTVCMSASGLDIFVAFPRCLAQSSSRRAAETRRQSAPWLRPLPALNRRQGGGDARDQHVLA